MSVMTKADVEVTGLRRTWDVTVGADGDDPLAIAHGFTCLGADNTAKDAYAKAHIVPVLTALNAKGALADFYVSGVDRTNITITRGITSSTATGAVRLTAWKVHSLTE